MPTTSRSTSGRTRPASRSWAVSSRRRRAHWGRSSRPRRPRELAGGSLPDVGEHVVGQRTRWNRSATTTAGGRRRRPWRRRRTGSIVMWLIPASRPGPGCSPSHPVTAAAVRPSTWASSRRCRRRRRSQVPPVRDGPPARDGVLDPDRFARRVSSIPSTLHGGSGGPARPARARRTRRGRPATTPVVLRAGLHTREPSHPAPHSAGAGDRTGPGPRNRFGERPRGHASSRHRHRRLRHCSRTGPTVWGSCGEVAT